MVRPRSRAAVSRISANRIRNFAMPGGGFPHAAITMRQIAQTMDAPDAHDADAPMGKPRPGWLEGRGQGAASST